MAVEHCVRANLGSHCILAQKQYCQKLMAKLNSVAFFTSVCVLKTIHEKFGYCLICKTTFYSQFVLTD